MARETGNEITIIPSTNPCICSYTSNIHCLDITVTFSIVVLCPDLSAPENGDIEYDTIQHVYMSRAIYNCDSGYMLEGSDTRMCQRNSEWSGTPPICKRKT